MAERTTIARPYAKAIFEVALQRDDLFIWSEVLRRAALVVQDKRMHALLFSPHVTADRLVELISSIVKEIESLGEAVVVTVWGESVEEFGESFLQLLADNYRLDLLPEISAIFDRLRAAAERIVDVSVTSAVPVSDAVQDKIKVALEQRFGRRVRLEFDTDPSLLGGAILQADDLVIDGSVRGKLEKLAAAMTH